jgi:hypothetical protein
VGCTNNPSGPPEASGRVTLDGVTEVVSNSRDAGAERGELDVGFEPSTGPQYEFGVQWNPGATTFDLARQSLARRARH